MKNAIPERFDMEMRKKKVLTKFKVLIVLAFIV